MEKGAKFEKHTPEEQIEIQKERTIKDAEYLKEGAEYVIDERGGFQKNRYHTHRGTLWLQCDVHGAVYNRHKQQKADETLPFVRENTSLFL